MGNGAEESKPTPGLKGHGKERKIRSAVWLNQAVQKLTKAGHPLRCVGEYTLDQFMVFLEAVEQLDAASRANFVADVGTVVGGILGGNKALTQHIDSLSASALGENNGSARK